ncbi:MAG: hypothetical protein JWQ76_2823 [Ramlibacter sp.]|nr:hypothetical protein [Ramlibacter sp.]
MRNKTTLAAVLAASLMGLGAAAHAQYSAIVSVAPPTPQVEVVPAPRQGHVWAPGHYEWRGNQYAWVQGYWLTARNGYDYREPRWVQRGNGEWVMVGGNWERGRWEREHDREYRDQARNGQYGPRGDMDGDGVQNRFDRFPRNPNRS